MSAFVVASDGQRLVVRVEGQGNMRNAPILDAFLSNEVDGPDPSVCIDLSPCTGMDSTFMGLMVGFQSAFQRRGGGLVVMNPSEVCGKLLAMLGLTEIIPVVTVQSMPALEFVRLDAPSGMDSVVGMAQRMELIRRAHLALMETNAGNRQKFAAFMEALERDMSRRDRPSE